jgi:hypothetical protein
VTSFLQRFRYGKPVVVISGLPRSGTSMSMKMLEAGGVETFIDGIRTADEDNPKGYFELERVKELDKTEDKAWVKEARGKAVKVISFLLKDLPDDNLYKVIFMIRPYEEILASQAKMLERRSEDNETSDERMTEIYENHVTRTKAMLRVRPNFEFLELKYHEVLADGAGAARKVDDFLGMKLDVKAMADVVDRSLYRNRS